MGRGRCIVVIAHGYGCGEQENVPYLREVKGIIHDLFPGYVILSGARTQERLYPGRSEAQVMHEFLDRNVKLGPASRSRVPRFGGSYFLDEKSYTTLDNAENAAQKIREIVTVWHRGDWSQVQVTVCCRFEQSFKTWLLYWLLLPELRAAGGTLEVRAINWRLRHENPFVELVKVFVDLLGVFVPPVRRTTSWLRKRRAKKL